MNESLTIVADGFGFTEGPRWHEGKLYFSDFYTHRVLAVDEAGQAATVVEVPNQPSGLGWLPDGQMLIVSMLDRKVLRLGTDGKLTEHADLGSIATYHCNDMVVASDGTAYVGNFGSDIEEGKQPQPATLARVDPKGNVSVAATGLNFPNGAVITPEGKTLIIGETWGACLTAFDIGESGELTGRRTWASTAPHVPDGICLDAEGAIWIADPAGNCVARIREGGEVLQTIATGRGAFACMLGGSDGRTLYICTADGSGSAVADSRTSRIEAVQVAVPRAGLP